MDKEIIKLFNCENIEELKQFFYSIANERYEYKVCLTQQSYLLSQILKNEKTEYGKDDFITSTALLALTTELAETYMMRKAFPEILICDAIIPRYAWKLNNYLLRLEEQIIQNVKSMGCQEEEGSIRTKVALSIKIKVFMKRQENMSLLSARYLTNFELYLEKDKYKNKCVNRNMINFVEWALQLGFSDNNFILHALVDEEKFENINTEYKKIETTYRGNTQIVYMKMLDFGEGSKAILTIRKNGEKHKDGKCYIIPNVFITEFEKAQKEEFLKLVCNKIIDKSIQEKFYNQLNNLKNVENEFISMLLNQILLSVFIEEGGLVQEETNLEEEINRVAHNFGDSLEIREIISYIKRHQIFSEQEFIDTIINLTRNSAWICKLRDSKEASELQADKLLDYMESYFYEMSLEQDKIFQEMENTAYRGDINSFYKIKNVNVNEFLEKAYESNSNSLSIVVAHLLQMMDIGIIMNYECKKTEYSQYLSMGNIARLIAAMNVFKYIGILHKIFLRNDAKSYEYKLEKNVDELIKANKFNYPKEDVEKIRKFLDEFEFIKQEPIEFAFSYKEILIRNAKNLDDRERISKIFEQMDESRKLEKMLNEWNNW